MERKDFMNMNEVTEMLGISKWTLYRWVSEKRIPCSKIGSLNRFKKQDVEKWISEQSFIPKGKPNK